MRKLVLGLGLAVAAAAAMAGSATVNMMAGTEAHTDRATVMKAASSGKSERPTPGQTRSDRAAAVKPREDRDVGARGRLLPTKNKNRRGGEMAHRRWRKRRSSGRG